MRNRFFLSVAVSLLQALPGCSDSVPDSPAADAAEKNEPDDTLKGSGGGGSDGGGGNAGGASASTTEVDVVVDANRDGVASADDPGDEDRETEWDSSTGAIFIANLDDDDQDGARDCDDEIVNGEADAMDLASFLVRPILDAPDGAVGVVAIDEEAAKSVRVFKQLTTGEWELALGSIGPCTSLDDCSYTLNAALTTEEIRAGATFAVEARRFKGQQLGSLSSAEGEALEADKIAWSGDLDISYAVTLEDGEALSSAAAPDGVDHAKMRVASWMMFGSLAPNDEVWSSNAFDVFVEGNEAFSSAAGVDYTAYKDSYGSKTGWGDIWTEDIFQTGWTGFPGPDGTVRGMRIANPRPWGRGDSWDRVPRYWLMGLPEEGREPAWLGPDRGVGVFYNMEDEGYGHTQDSHGAHDLIPPHDGFPMGRIITSSEVMEATRNFYDQQVQGPALILDTSWLAVEHVDEFFHWVPANTARGWKLLVASPSRMTKLLQALAGTGHGSAVLHDGKGSWYELTVDEALADEDLIAWSQVADVKIQGHVETVKQETGLTDDEIIEIPTWFEDLDVDEKVAWNPGMVNMRLLGNRANIAMPFGPIVDGSDAFEDDVLAQIGSPESQLGSDGNGLQIFWTDDWDYHEALGEVHCGTNEDAPVTASLGLWWEGVK